FWGIENVLPEMFDDKGTSLVFVNSDKGQTLFNSISERTKYIRVDINEAVKYNTSAYSNVYRPRQRKRFMNKVKKCNFKDITEKYRILSIEDRIILKLRSICKRINIKFK
ncbi:MAG: (4Fe-4S)-binding protein, partial [bacterium]|nr:(4Fe-4S)-binding protein [bacterium]